MIRIESTGDVAEALGLLRRLRQQTQEAIAEAADVHAGQISAWENGRKTPTVATLIRMLEALGFALEVVALDQSGPGRALSTTQAAETGLGIDRSRSGGCEASMRHTEAFCCTRGDCPGHIGGAA